MKIFKKYKTIEELLPGFILERQMQAKYKNSQSYLHNCSVFIEWLKDNSLHHLPLRKIDHEIIAKFFQFLAMDKHLDRPTCEKYFMHLRLFFRYAQERGEIREVPFDLVKFPKKGLDKSPEVIREGHLKILLDRIKEKDPQLYLACMIQYYCFIRPGRELRLLKIRDIDLNQGVIKIVQENAKNNLRQIVTMPNQLLELCYEYGIDQANEDFYVFGNKKKFGPKPCSINMLRYRFNKVRDELGLPKGYKLYSMKHTGATRLHLSGISIRELMDQLRHTKLEATQHYVKTKMGVINPKVRDHFPSPN
jgi:integrase